MFEHKNLDGTKNRMINGADSFIGDEILEIRDPKNGESVEKACRTQYAVASGVLVERYLPPESIGDAWPHDAASSPWWVVVGHPPHGGLVADYNSYAGGEYKRALDPDKNVVAFAGNGEEVTLVGSQYTVTRQTDSKELQSQNLVNLRAEYYAA